MDSKKSNKIREIVRLQQILKKWKKLANAPKPPTTSTAAATTTTATNGTMSSTSSSSNGSKGMKFLKRTLSFTDVSSGAHQSDTVPKGFLAICVGKELKRFIIPTEYLGHKAFQILLREAEEEFGFHQAGVLKIPCEVAVFEKILKVVEEKREVFFLQSEFGYVNAEKDRIGFCSSPSDCDLTPSHHPQMCR